MKCLHLSVYYSARIWLNIPVNTIVGTGELPLAAPGIRCTRSAVEKYNNLRETQLAYIVVSSKQQKKNYVQIKQWLYHALGALDLNCSMD